VNKNLKYAAALAIAMSITCGVCPADAEQHSFAIGSWVYTPLIGMKDEPAPFSFLSGFSPDGDDPYVQILCQGKEFKFKIISRSEVTSLSNVAHIRMTITIDGVTKLSLVAHGYDNFLDAFYAPLTQDQISALGTAKKTISVSVADAPELPVLTIPAEGTAAAFSVLADMCAYGKHT
jgi:hypothetical protein